MIANDVFDLSGAWVRYWRRPWLQALLKAGLAVRQPKTDGTPNPRGEIIPGVIPHDFRRTANSEPRPRGGVGGHRDEAVRA